MQCILQELQYLEDNVVVVDDPHQQQHHQQQQQQQQQQQPLEYTNHHTSTIPHTSHSNHQLPDDPLKELNGSSLHRTFTSSTSNSMSSKDLIASFIHDDPHIMLEHHCVCKIPILASWRLNERSYGALVGMSKSGAEEYYGKAQLDPWRHGWDVRPPPMPDDVVQDWSQRHPHCRMVTIIQTPQTIPTPSPQQHHGIPTSSTRVASTVQVMEKGLPWHGSVPIMPASESLADTCHRVLPLWEWGIAPRLLRGENVLLVAHANTVKAMLRLLDPHIVTPDGFSRLKIPNTTPLVYQFQPASPYDDDMIPGGLAVVPPPPCLDWNETRPTNNVTPPSQSSPQAIPSTEELRYHLRAQWLG
jgi:bisphosphoglycerate-dependent phosphoglycerate mutase